MTYSPGELYQGYRPIHRRLSRCGDELTYYAKLVFYDLIERIGETGTAWPSQARISSDTGLSDSSVTRALRELKAIGFVKSKRQGPGQANLYTLEMGAILAWANKPVLLTNLPSQEDGSIPSGGRTEEQPKKEQPIEALMAVPTEPPALPVSDKSVSLPKPTKVTEGFISLIHGEYDPQIGPQQVSDTISYWLGHQGFRMQADKQAFLWKKMGEHADRLRSNGRPQVSYNPVASDAYMLPEVRVKPKVAR